MVSVFAHFPHIFPSSEVSPSMLCYITEVPDAEDEEAVKFKMLSEGFRDDALARAGGGHTADGENSSEPPALLIRAHYKRIQPQPVSTTTTRHCSIY